MKKYTEEELNELYEKLNKIYEERYEDNNDEEMTWDLENLVWKNDEYYLNKFSEKMVADLELNDRNEMDIVTDIIKAHIEAVNEEIWWV